LRMLTATIFMVGSLLLSRIIGLIRDVSIASTYGVSRESDFILLLVSFPDLIVSILVAGGVSGCLVPKLAPESISAQTEIISSVSRVVIAITFVLCTLIMISPEQIIFLLAPGLGSFQTANEKTCIVLAAWALIPLALSILYSGWIEAREQAFYVPLTSVAYSFLLIVSVWVGFFSLTSSQSLILISGGVFIASCTKVGLLKLKCANPRPQTTSITRLNATFWSDFGKSSLTGFALLATPVIFRALYSMGGDGSFSEFIYAQRILDLAIGLAAAPIFTLMMPQFAKTYELDKCKHFSITKSAASLTLSLGFAISLILAQHSHDIVRLLYGWNPEAKFNLQEVARSLRMMAISVPFFFGQGILTTICQSRNQAEIPLQAMLISLSAVIMIGFYLHYTDTLKLQDFALFGLISTPLASSVLTILKLRSTSKIYINLSMLVSSTILWGIILFFLIDSLGNASQFNPQGLIISIAFLIAPFVACRVDILTLLQIRIPNAK